MISRFPYNMRGFAWEYLNKNKDLIKINYEEIELLKQRGLLE